MTDNNIKEQPETYKAWVMGLIEEGRETPKEQLDASKDFIGVALQLDSPGGSVDSPTRLAKLFGFIPYDNLSEWFEDSRKRFDPELPALTEAEWQQAEAAERKRQQENLLKYLDMAADRAWKDYMSLRKVLAEESRELAKLNQRELARKRSLLVWWNLEGRHKFGREG